MDIITDIVNLGRKAIRQQQLRLIQRRKQELDEQQKQIDEQRQDIEGREKKMLEVKDLLPSAKQLKDIGVGFVEALVWLDCIEEVSEKERVNRQEALLKLHEMLRSFKTLSALEKAVQQAKQQLALLNTTNDQQRKAISTLVSLQTVGTHSQPSGSIFSDSLHSKSHISSEPSEFSQEYCV